MDVKNDFELPKNIKQIGQAPDGQKVYMEDYVVTYLKQLLVQEKEMKVSILYGKKQIIQDELYWFVSGAIEAETDFFMHKTLLDEEAWQKANDLAKRFFDDMIVLGWAIARPESQDPLQEQIIRTHKNFFRLDQKLFFEYITDENKETLYLIEKGKLNQQSGYFVYYDKNESMQNYMVSLRSSERYPEEFEADRAMKQIRENREEKKQLRSRRRTTTVLTCFSMILVTTIMIIGITMMNNYEKMENMEKILNQISGKMERSVVTGTDVSGEQMENENVEEADNLLTMNEAEKSNMPVMQEILTDEDFQTSEESVVERVSEEPVSESVAMVEENEKPKEEITVSEDSQPVQEEMQDDSQDTEVLAEISQEKTEYMIKEGDTLASISLEHYGDMSHIDAICDLNHIENKDNIYYGQKIYLPR